MRDVRFEIFPQTAEQSRLRFFGPDGSMVGDRPLATADVDRFIAEVEAGYHAVSPDLAALGRRLYAWLDGPTERWLATARQGPPGLAIHIDGGERLRHLPWELIQEDGTFLCALPASPLTPVRRGKAAGRETVTANRPLRLLLMACSPGGVSPVLEYEREEAMILDATRRPAIELAVEESGSLEGLIERIESAGAGYFDVFHLSGHADVKDGKPIFWMETDTGSPRPADAEELANAFAGSWPALVFLSGCKTGQAVDQGSLPSLCEQLVEAGAPAVLGWSLPVGDTAANVAAAELYHHLASGKAIDEAVARARAALHKAPSRYWHLLLLYTGRSPLGALVTTPTTPGRERFFIRPASQEFLDVGAKSEVCPRDRFVGRRRALQRCLKVLRSVEEEDFYQEGVLLHGMGGLGKSSLAARLCDRMAGHRHLVWVGKLDETQLLHGLGGTLDDPEAVAALNEPRQSLRQRLCRLFETALVTRPALFVFDDFEQNVEKGAEGAPRLAPDGRAILEPAALGVLTSLLAALRDTGSASRVLVTCRYQFPLPGPASLYLEKLETFRGADLEKKLSSLPALRPEARTDPALRHRATELAAGNPRLLERLNTVLADETTDHEAVLSTLESTAESFREEALLRTLLDLQPPEGRALLARLAVYRLPVDRVGVEAVAGELPVDSLLLRAIAMGLVESAPDPENYQQRYYVSVLLQPLLEPELTGEEFLQACRQGAHLLYQSWWNEAGRTSEERILEIHRLAILGTDCEIAVAVADSIATRWINLSRFREAEFLSQATLAQCPDHRILHTLARAEWFLGKTDAARAHYEQALSQSPATQAVSEHSSLLHNLAVLTAQRGDIEQAFGLWKQSLDLSEKISDVEDKAATLHQMASVIAQQGDVEQALGLWKQSLELYEKIGNVKGKSTTLHNMAGVIAKQGDVEQALGLWEQSLELYEKTGDVQGKAATLHQMAGVIAQRGDVEQALRLWKQSLALEEKIGNVQGKAVTLMNMAWAAGQQGDLDRERRLNREAAQALAAVHAWLDMITVLGNLGSSEDPDSTGFLAQAFWLASHVQASINATISVAAALVQKLDPAADAALSVATAAVALSHLRGHQHPQQQKFQKFAGSLLLNCAQARQVPEAELTEWLGSLGLNDPARWQPALDQTLEFFVGDADWLFERSLISSPS